MLLFFGSSALSAGIPVGCMTSSSIGIEYDGIMSGQIITRANVTSHLNAHYLTIRYTPLRLLLVSLGIGGTRFATDAYDSTRFTGNAGISMNGGIALYSPDFFSLLRITGGIEGYALNSSKDGYRYTAGLANPYLGLIVLAGTLVDIQIGVKGHLVYGKMSAPGVDDGRTFGNTTYPRGFGSITLHSVNSGAYATLGLDASQKLDRDWSDGPREAALSLQVGYIIRDLFNAGARGKKSASEANFDKMKEHQDKMAEQMKK
jgi:hypothetical protein